MDDDNAADNDNLNPQPPPANDGGQTEEFMRALESVESNKSKRFFLRDALPQLPQPDVDGFWLLSLEQARELADALKKSTSIELFSIDVGCCEVEAIAPLIDYVRSSTILQEVIAGYSRDDGDEDDQDDDETRQRYKAELNLLYRAIRENENILGMKAFYPLASPESVCDLLANTKSLTHFKTDALYQIPVDMARQMATGFSQNKNTLRCVSLDSGPLDILLPGLSGSSVESLQLLHGAMATDDVDLGKAISTMLFSTPSLNKFKLYNRTDTHDGNAAQDLSSLFLNLRNPVCEGEGLKKLMLHDFSLSADALDTSSLEIGQATDQTNTSLQVLELNRIRFETPSAVRLLWNVVGLEELTIEAPTYGSSTNTQNDTLVGNWSKFIRGNSKLSKLKIILNRGHGGHSDHDFMYGTLEGVHRLTSLTELTIAGERWFAQPDAPRMPVRGVVVINQLSYTSMPLKKLKFDGIQLDGECTAVLVGGLRFYRTLQSLHFAKCVMQAQDVTDIMESLQVNPRLETLGFEDLRLSEPISSGDFYQTLYRLFSTNKSLITLMLSMVDLRGTAMSEALIGLRENNALLSLLFDNKCLIDNEGMAALGMALESTNIGEIGLPKHKEGEQVEKVLHGTRALVRSMVRMPNMRIVHFGHTLKELDDEEQEDMRGLLLDAVRTNKTIRYIYDIDFSHADMIEVDFYLRLNYFGRHLLDSPNVLTSLWPYVFTPMARRLGGADALFYFLREYFSRQGTYDAEEPEGPHQPPPEGPHQPPKKKSRVA